MTPLPTLRPSSNDPGEVTAGVAHPQHIEAELLLVCGRSRLEPIHLVRGRELLSQVADWERVLTAAAQNGMLPLLHSALQQMRPAAAEALALQLEVYYRQNAAQALRLSATLVSILRLLGDAGVLAVPYKGPPLALRLYGDIARRQAGDIDILLRHEDVVRARELLIGCGYAPRYPGSAAKDAFRLANRYSDELVASDGTQLELHWAFANRDIPFGLGLEEMRPRLRSTSFAGTTIQEMPAEDLLVILSVHGAKHRWDRLEWIVGVAELIRKEAIDWEAAIELAERYHARRTLLLALNLVHGLLEVELPERVFLMAAGEKWVGILANDVRTRLLAAPYLGEQSFRDVLSRNLFQYPLQQTPGDKLRYLLYRMTTPNRPDNWHAVNVGARPLALHALIWPLRLGLKIATLPVRHGGRRK